MEFDGCDGETMRKIFAKLTENFNKRIPATTPFSIVDEKAGTTTEYEMINTTPVARLSTAVHDIIGKSPFGLNYAYFVRMQILFSFTHENREELKGLGLLKEEDNQDLLAYSMFDAIAIAKINKKGKLTRKDFFKAHKKVA